MPERFYLADPVPAENPVDSVKKSAGISVATTQTSASSSRHNSRGKLFSERPGFGNSVREIATIQELIDAAPDALVIVDVPGAITLVNRRAEGLLGYSRGEVLGESWAVLIGGRNRNVSLGVLAESVRAMLARNDNPPPFEIVARRKDGTDIPVEVSLTGLEMGGRGFVVAAARDVSARKQLEQECLGHLAEEQSARAEAEAAVRLRDAHLAMVTHDLKGSLTVILGRAQLIEEMTSELGGHPTAAHILALSKRISDSTADMALVLHELRDIAQLRIGQPLALNRAGADLATLALRVASEHAVDDQQRIQVQVPVEPVIGHWDASRLERVLHNLIENAHKYSPDGTQVTVTVSCDGDSAVLEVSDEGIGIPAADQPHVFDWFRRGTNVAAIAPGTGLGLAGVRQIVELHGGSVSVTSKEGSGSVFTVRLPLQLDIPPAR
jgi:PAS domain S-box-containing protein